MYNFTMVYYWFLWFASILHLGTTSKGINFDGSNPPICKYVNLATEDKIFFCVYVRPKSILGQTPFLKIGSLFSFDISSEGITLTTEENCVTGLILQNEILIPVTSFVWINFCCFFDGRKDELKCFSDGKTEPIFFKKSDKLCDVCPRKMSDDATNVFSQCENQSKFDKKFMNQSSLDLTKLCIGSKGFFGDIAQTRFLIGKDINFDSDQLNCGEEMYETNIKDETIVHFDDFSTMEVEMDEICNQTFVFVRVEEIGSYENNKRVCKNLGGTMLAPEDLMIMPSREEPTFNIQRLNETFIEEEMLNKLDIKMLDSGEGILPEPEKYVFPEEETLRKSKDEQSNFLWLSNIKKDKKLSVPLCPILTDANELSLTSCFKQLSRGYCKVYHKVFTLHGHNGNFFDHFYYLNYENETLSWIGINKSKIHKSQSNWILTSELYGNRWILENKHLPIGRAKWTILDDTIPNLTYQTLTLSSCHNGEFACNDGQCVPSTERCDEQYNCFDHSDEENCQIIKTLDDYNPLYVPPQRDGEVFPLNLDYHVDVNNLEKITSDEGIARMDISLTMRWYDPRVSFNHLKMDKKNLLSCDTLWIPVVRAVSGFGEGSVLETTTYDSKCFVYAKNQSQERLLSDPFMGLSSSGSSLPIVYLMGVLAKVPCRFDLPRFPFDKQYCNITFMAMNAPGSRVFQKFTSGRDVPYLNKNLELLEYQLKAITTETSYFMQGDDNNTYFVITYHLQRLYGYHLMNSFFPSLLFILIAFSTFFFQLDDFYDRIMVTITAQLIIASLYSSIASSSVRTPYLKLIDVWFAVIVIIGFWINICQGVVNLVIYWPKFKSWSSRNVINVQPIGTKIVNVRKNQVTPNFTSKGTNLPIKMAFLPNVETEIDRNRIVKMVNFILGALTLVFILVFVFIYSIICIG